MDLSKLIPQFRIEIRRIGSTANEPWLVAELAHTELHAQAKIVYWKKQSDDLEVRSVNNFLTPAATPTLPVPAPAPVVSAPAAAAKAPVQPPLTTPPAIVATAPAAIPPATAGAAEAAAGATPISDDYAIGKKLRDIHTGHVVTVTGWNATHKVGPAAGTHRPGFEWVCEAHPDDHPDKTGFCPLPSVGCFEPVVEAATAAETVAEKPSTPPAPPAPPAAAPKHARPSAKRKHR